MSCLKTIFTLVAIAASVKVVAQKEVKIRNNEFGVMADVTIGNPNVRTHLFGVQFRHFREDIYRNNTFGYRLSAGVGDVFHDDVHGSIYKTNSQDSIKRIVRDQWHKLYFIGLGVDAQRNFYKSVSVYAALNINIGYGMAGIDSTTDFPILNSYGSYSTNPIVPSTTNKIEVANALWIGLSPTIGIKLAVGKRIWVGTEFGTVLTISNAPVDTKGTRILNVDLEPGRINERFFVSYRF